MCVTTRRIDRYCMLPSEEHTFLICTFCRWLVLYGLCRTPECQRNACSLSVVDRRAAWSLSVADRLSIFTRHNVCRWRCVFCECVYSLTYPVTRPWTCTVSARLYDVVHTNVTNFTRERALKPQSSYVDINLHSPERSMAYVPIVLSPPSEQLP